MITISIDPVAFSIGSLVVRWYGIMTALSVIALLVVTLRETKRLGISQDLVFNLFLWGIIGGFIGGRSVHIIDHWSYYVANPGDIVGFAGLALYGAILGSLVGVWIYMRVKRTPFSSLSGVGDAIAIGAPLAQAIGRIGCTINGCCFGKPSPFASFPGAVIYSPRDTIPFEYWGMPLYPAQIYFLIWNLIVFAVLWQLRDRLNPRGSLFFLYLCLYAAGDFGFRFFRYADTSYLLGLQQGQIISLAILVIAVPWLIIRMRRFRSGANSSPSSSPEAV
ncbi:MAG: prolipoprotein diacylglyceryl transferase [Chloroflexota bacterium]|nr:prolipoprotein diacylglyceryl transferase [Chloroflexota bacterium]